MYYVFNRQWLWLLAGLWLLLAAGCMPTYVDTDGTFTITPRQSYSLKPYIIEPPDVITILAPNIAELNNVTQTVRPDGRVTFNLIDSHLAAGKTPAELAMEIQERASQFYEDVQIRVRVDQFNSKFYYMAGETSMGPVPYTGKSTVLSAVMQAGLPRTAWPEKGILIRPSEDPQLIRRMTVDIKAMIEKGDLSQNAVLEEGDILFIPIHPFAHLAVALGTAAMPTQPLIQVASTPSRLYLRSTDFVQGRSNNNVSNFNSIP